MKKILLLIILLTVSLMLAGCIKKTNLNSNSFIDDTLLDKKADEIFSFTELEYDFGVIKQSGDIVNYDFNFVYNGKEDLTIIAVPTSCGCTSATINKQTLSPGDEAIITVSFDPNLHEEPKGRFFKTITLLTEPKIDNPPELKIWAEIDLDLGPEAYKLKGEHLD